MRQSELWPGEIIDHLTERQMEIACHLAGGLTYREIARELRISEHTVHEHVRHIYERVGDHNRARLLATVVRAGWCDDLHQ